MSCPISPHTPPTIKDIQLEGLGYLLILVVNRCLSLWISCLTDCQPVQGVPGFRPMTAGRADFFVICLSGLEQ